jgi:hypothetical protein
MVRWIDEAAMETLYHKIGENVKAVDKFTITASGRFSVGSALPRKKAPVVYPPGLGKSSLS